MTDNAVADGDGLHRHRRQTRRCVTASIIPACDEQGVRRLDQSNTFTSSCHFTRFLTRSWWSTMAAPTALGMSCRG